MQVFDAPERVMVGTRGPVGERMFLLQARQGRRLVVVKCEKQQLAALATWIGEVLETLGRPGHLPEDLELEPEYEPDLEAGEIVVALDEVTSSLEVTLRDGDDGVVITLTREWAGALAIAITRLVERGRPPCPLCGLPLDPRGHDCPRTNGHRAPRR